MKPPPPLFLERRGYRRRRLIDAARFLPALGAALWALPLLWGGEGRSTTGFALVFAVWAGLIAAAFALSRSLARGEPAGGDPAGLDGAPPGPAGRPGQGRAG